MLRRGMIERLMRGTQKRKMGRPGLERPKSREETPKEGYDKTSWARNVASQKLRVRRTIFNCIFCRAA
jgi:hypothetical protein